MRSPYRSRSRVARVFVRLRPHDTRLELEKTAPFEMGQGDDACLLLHGFTGSPWDVRPLGEELARRGYYVRAIRLPGHGATLEAMGEIRHRDWENAGEEALAALKNFRQVFVAGLSMGALLSVLLAARHPERVHGLALLAPAVRFKGRALRLLRSFRSLPLLETFKPIIGKESTDIEDPDVRAEAPVLRAFPSVWLHELWKIQDAALEAMPLVKCPALVAVAARDHVVDTHGAKLLVRTLTSAPMVRFIEIQEGFHILPRDRGRAVVLEEVGAFFERLRG